ncbi:MAG: Stp1/IreP family PP2C-type Ser/Thr phosphatase [Fimbriimonadaceae bacterium]
MDEITAEYAVDSLVEAAPLRLRPVVTVACKTDLGRVRENNEDKFEYFLADRDEDVALRGHAFVVCDGMGGHEAGQIASELACKTFLDVYRGHPANDVEAALVAAVRAANRFVLDVARAMPNRRGMGTTLTALVLVQDRAWVAHVGDSRCYRLRGDELEQITVDHTWVEDAVRTMGISREEAERHPYRHVITRAIGTEDVVVPDVLGFDLAAGDIFLICSDGLTNHVSDEEIASCLLEYGPSEAVWRLVGRALVDGGSDNCTAVAVRVDELRPAGNETP